MNLKIRRFKHIETIFSILETDQPIDRPIDKGVYQLQAPFQLNYFCDVPRIRDNAYLHITIKPKFITDYVLISLAMISKHLVSKFFK